MSSARQVFRWFFVLGVSGGAAAPAMAVKLSDELDVGGAIRLRADNDERRGIREVGLDTIILRASYDDSRWSAGASYRFYGKEYPYQYVSHFGDVQFAEYAWIGYAWDGGKKLTIGLDRLPFGLTPYLSSTFYQSLGNVVGLEDVSMLGIKYAQGMGDWNLQLGYYARRAWAGHGTSNGSTFAIVVTPADHGLVGGSRNDERGLAAARVTRSTSFGGWDGDIGASALVSTLHNRDTHADGRRMAYALHYAGKQGAWGVKLQYTRQQMLPQNPYDRRAVSFGGFDGTFNVAARGNFYSGDLSYTLPGSYAGDRLRDVSFYANYSLYEKSFKNFRNSQRMILGTSFALRPVWVSLEWLAGRNDPYLGGSGYAQSAAAGGGNVWSGQLFMNVGYYF